MLGVVLGSVCNIDFINDNVKSILHRKYYRNVLDIVTF